MSLTVFILDYKRFPTVLHHILPSLMSVDCINQIVIAHATTEYLDEKDNRFCQLEANEIRITNMNEKQLIRIQDSDLNDTYECYRRWIWIEKLVKDGLIQNPLLLTHDDDFIFADGEIERLVKLKDKGIIVCGEGGRSSDGTSYSFRRHYGACNIALGQSMLLNTSSILEATALVQKHTIPPEILHEDDIVISFLIGKGNPVHYGAAIKKQYFITADARFRRPNHIALRLQTINYMLTLLKASL